MSTSIFRRARTSAAVASIGLLATVAGACAGSDSDTPAAASPLDSIVPIRPAVVPQFDAAPEDLAGDADVEPGSDPIEVVRQYLSAEMTRDYATSYATLAASSRESVGSATDWAQSAYERPTVLAFQLEPTSVDPLPSATDLEVTGMISLEPRLDEVNGFVPARAEAEFVVVSEDGGWRVDVDESSLDPILPDDQGASAAAERWASARQQCSNQGEYGGSMVGSPALGDRLCGVKGELIAGAPRPLGDELATQVVAAFGPGATTWARSVTLTGAADLSVVTAPFGDHWVVVGVGA